jgi:cytochrome P450
MSPPPEPPAPPGLPLVGNTLAYANDRFAFVEDARRECGDVFSADLLGLGRVCYLTHPDHFERVLTTDREAFGKGELFRTALGDGLLAVEGTRWERQRDLLEEFFSPERVRSYATEIVRLTERRIDRWEDGETRSLAEETSALTLEILFGTLFGRGVDPELDRSVRRAAADLNAYFTPASLVLPESLPTPARRRFERARSTLRTTLLGLLDDVPEDGDGDSDDLLSVFARFRAYEVMSEDAIADQLLTLVFAGHETSALALTYALFELGLSRSIGERFFTEVDAVLDGDPPTPADLSDLQVTGRLVAETLRFYPPAHTVPRVAVREVDVGGYRIPAGTPTFLALHSVHRDGRFYDDPRSFRPGRWREASSQSKGFAYVPFGAGPRTCIGRRFALMEARLVLATVGRRFRLDPETPLTLDPAMSTRPTGDVPVTVRQR